jgi:molybdopterin-biosynthesis enzyme MoeA-like protein
MDTAQSRIRYFEEKIRSNPEWMKLIRRKAMEQKVDPEEMIRRDALFMVNEELKAKNK